MADEDSGIDLGEDSETAAAPASTEEPSADAPAKAVWVEFSLLF